MADPRHKALRACEMTLYPCRDSLIEAVEFIESQAPIEAHEIFPLLMLYHNTLIKELAHDSPQSPVGHTGNVTPIFGKALPRSDA